MDISPPLVVIDVVCGGGCCGEGGSPAPELPRGNPPGLFRSLSGIGDKEDRAAGITEDNAFGGILTELGGSSDAGIGVRGSWASLGRLNDLEAAEGLNKSGGFLAEGSFIFTFSSLTFSLLDFLSRLFNLSSLDKETGLDSSFTFIWEISLLLLM